MSQSIAEFYRELFREHVDSAGFLHELWEQRIAEPTADLAALAEMEERIEAHLDALLVGGAPALAVCCEFAGSGEPGERQVAARLFCRARQADALRELLGALADAPEAMRPVARVLAIELPEDWIAPLLRAIPTAPPQLLVLYAELCGLRRLPAEQALLAAWPRADGAARERLVWALGRTPGQAAAQALAQLDADGLTSQRELALLRKGVTGNALPLSRPLDPDRLLLLGMTGNAETFELLLEQRASNSAVIALGLLGDPRALEVLLALLADDAQAMVAAWALRLLTGAAPREEVFVAETPDPHSLFPMERSRYLAGQPPQAPGAWPYGTRQVRLSRNAEHWQAELAARPPATGGRLRHGLPATPLAVAAPLFETDWPRRLRQLALDELQIRYTIDLAFEADSPVREQWCRLQAFRQAPDAGLPPGRWYLGGQALA